MRPPLPRMPMVKSHADCEAVCWLWCRIQIVMPNPDCDPACRMWCHSLSFAAASPAACRRRIRRVGTRLALTGFYIGCHGKGWYKKKNVSRCGNGIVYQHLGHPWLQAWRNARDKLAEINRVKVTFLERVNIRKVSSGGHLDRVVLSYRVGHAGKGCWQTGWGKQTLVPFLQLRMQYLGIRRTLLNRNEMNATKNYGRVFDTRILGRGSASTVSE